MKISRRQLKRIIKEEYSRIINESLYGSSNSTGDFYEVIAQEASYAYNDGVRRVGDFIKIVLPIGMKAGYKKAQIVADARTAWKLEKEAQKPFDARY